MGQKADIRKFGFLKIHYSPHAYLHLALQAPHGAVAVVSVGAGGEEAGVDDRLAEGAAEDGAAANLLPETKFSLRVCRLIFKNGDLYLNLIKKKMYRMAHQVVDYQLLTRINKLGTVETNVLFLRCNV